MNDNKPHSLIPEYMYWKNKVHPHLWRERELPLEAQRLPFKKRDQYMKNVIWFLRFEILWDAERRKEVRSKVRLVYV